MSDENQGEMFGPNPGLYRELSIPFPTHEAANEALSAFFKDVAEARKKHRIPEVVVLTEARYIEPEGGEATGAASVRFGNLTNALPMLAAAYGAERERFDAMVDKLASVPRSARARGVK